MELIIKHCAELYADKDLLKTVKLNIMLKLTMYVIFGIVFYLLTNSELILKHPTQIGFVMVLLIMAIGAIISEDVSQKLKQAYLLNLVMPGRKARMRSIKELIELNEKNKIIIKRNNFTDSEKILNLTKHNLKDWIDTYIGKETSLHNLINQRVLGSEMLKMGLIYWSQLIPRKRLKLDELRAILLSNQISEENFPDLEIVNIEHLFSLYNNKQILLIFTSGYKLETFYHILRQSHKLGGIPFEVKSNMLELSLWLNNMIRAKESSYFQLPIDKKWIAKLEQASLESGSFVYLRDLIEIERWGNYMNNCLRDPLKHNNLYMFGVMKNRQPMYMLALDGKGNIQEVKKRRNQGLSSEELRLLNREVSSLC